MKAVRRPNQGRIKQQGEATPKGPRVCRFHSKFGEQARNRLTPCTWRLPAPISSSSVVRKQRGCHPTFENTRRVFSFVAANYTDYRLRHERRTPPPCPFASFCLNHDCVIDPLFIVRKGPSRFWKNRFPKVTISSLKRSGRTTFPNALSN